MHESAELLPTVQITARLDGHNFNFALRILSLQQRLNSERLGHSQLAAPSSKFEDGDVTHLP